MPHPVPSLKYVSRLTCASENGDSNDEVSGRYVVLITIVRRITDRSVIRLCKNHLTGLFLLLVLAPTPIGRGNRGTNGVGEKSVSV